MKLICKFGFMVCCCFASVLSAASVPIPNFSFENPNVADGTATTSIPGWTITVNPAQGSAGIYDPVNAQYANVTGDNTPISPFGPADRGQSAFVSLTEGQATLAIPDLGLIVQPNTRYSLTAALGYRLDANRADTTIRLVINGVHLGGTFVTGRFFSKGAFQDFDTQLGPLLPTDSRIGGTLGIELVVSVPQGTPTPVLVDIDNVRMTALPEPAGLGVVLMTCLHFLRRSRSRSLYQLPRRS